MVIPAMVKFFLNKPFKNGKQKPAQQILENEGETKKFFIYIEYAISNKINSFSAYHTAAFSGHGFVDVIHPALAIHQIACNRNQISFGVIFELDLDHDIDAAYTPNHSKIVWKKNIGKYDPAALDAIIAKANPHKVKFGDFDQTQV